MALTFTSWTPGQPQNNGACSFSNQLPKLARYVVTHTVVALAPPPPPPPGNLYWVLTGLRYGG